MTAFAYVYAATIGFGSIVVSVVLIITAGFQCLINRPLA